MTEAQGPEGADGANVTDSSPTMHATTQRNLRIGMTRRARPGPRPISLPYPPLRARSRSYTIYLLFTSFRHYVSQRISYICPISSLFSPFLTHIKYISRTSQENRPSSPRPLPLPLQGPRPPGLCVLSRDLVNELHPLLKH